MADQILFSAAKAHVSEKSQYAVVARFRTRATGDVMPTNVKYRIDCLATGAEILGWTSLTPAVSVTITVTPAQNAIQYDGNASERKQITVSADHDLATEFNAAHVYEVRNNRGYT